MSKRFIIDMDELPAGIHDTVAAVFEYVAEHEYPRCPSCRCHLMGMLHSGEPVECQRCGTVIVTRGFMREHGVPPWADTVPNGRVELDEEPHPDILRRSHKFAMNLYKLADIARSKGGRVVLSECPSGWRIEMDYMNGHAVERASLDGVAERALELVEATDCRLCLDRERERPF